MSLDDLRRQLSDIDRQLISLVAERQRIVGAIGRDKLASGRATRDFEREKTVLGNAREQAEQLGVDADLAEQIMTALIQSSLTSQEKDRAANGDDQ